MSFGLGTSIISDTTYIKFSVSPNYKKDNFFIGVDLNGYFNIDGHTISKDWDDIFDVIDRTYGYYNYVNHKTNLYLHQVCVEKPIQQIYYNYLYQQ